MIRVAYNATPLLSPPTGIGNYIAELGRAMSANRDLDAYSFYRYRWRHELPRPRYPPPGARRTAIERVKSSLRFHAGLRELSKRLGFRRGLRRYRIELYHEPNYTPLAYDVPVVVSLHDLSWMHYPEAHPVHRVRWLDKELPRALEEAAAIIVGSDHVRDEVLGTFGIDPRRVHTVHHGVGAEFRPRTAEETAPVRQALGLAHRGYVLTVGTLEPRKNLLHTLDAYERLPATLRARYPLVVAGAKGWNAGALHDRLRRMPGNDVRFLGRVEPDALASLYSGAALFLFPSLYEGFGLPPLEAMASGTPVVVARRGALPEVVGDAGELIDAIDPDDTARRLAGLLEDRPRREALSARGRERARGFTWAACASGTYDVYCRALGRRNVGGDEARVPVGSVEWRSTEQR